jgi:hypothetical protein
VFIAFRKANVRAVSFVIVAFEHFNPSIICLGFFTTNVVKSFVVFRSDIFFRFESFWSFIGNI